MTTIDTRHRAPVTCIVDGIEYRDVIRVCEVVAIVTVEINVRVVTVDVLKYAFHTVYPFDRL